jgi:hypothetical protein
MKITIALAGLLLPGIGSIAISGNIVCGTNQGEIYLAAVHPRYIGFAGFYYSQDYGENIVLRDSTGDYINFGLFADAADNILYRGQGTIYIDPRFYITHDGGFSWNLVDTTSNGVMASGVITGELYRIISQSDSLERSIDYGTSYHPCTCAGGPDMGPHSVALGADSGEVYVLGDQGRLFYSQDFAKNFSFLADLDSVYNIYPYSRLYNGKMAGEVYILDYQYGPGFPRVWRISEYGAIVEMIAVFDLQWWYCDLATGPVPGELYFLAQFPDMVPGGIIRIYHTTDYFQTWTMYEHIVNWEGVQSPKSHPTPANITFNIWPNPTNAAFNISYELNAMQDVRLTMYDVLGRQVWRNDVGTQPPGVHRLSFADDELPSGRYFLVLESQQGRIRKAVTIIK